jgi:hypothetical protein
MRYLYRKYDIVKKKSLPQLYAMADNFGCRLLCCHLLSLLLIFQKSEEAVLLPSWYISLGFLFVICNKVLVVEYAIFDLKSRCSTATSYLPWQITTQRIGA